MKDYYVKLPLYLLQSDITASELKILMLFASYNNNGKLCYLSFENIAEQTKQDKRNTRRTINALIEKGLVKIERLKYEGYKNPVNAYSVIWQETEEAEAITEEQAKKGHKKSKYSSNTSKKSKNKVVHEVPEWFEQYEKKWKEKPKESQEPQESAEYYANKLFGGGKNA